MKFVTRSVLSLSFAPAAMALLSSVALLCAGCPDTMKAKPPPLLAAMKACVDNLQIGDYNAAETNCEICLEYDESTPECINGMGLVWYARGNDDKARSWFKKAIRVNNDFAEARNNMGVLEFENADYAAAVPYFESAIEIDPRYQDGRYNLALSHLRLGQRAMAQIKDEESRLKKASEHFVDAEDQYRKMMELYPTHVGTYHDMGVIMSFRASLEPIENKRRELISDAETYWVRCLDLEPQNKGCHGNIAHMFLGVGRYDESLFHYVQCLAADKEDPICLSEIKLAYEGSQLKSEALTKYMTQLAENPGYGQGHYGFCKALFDKGLVDMAVTECENALKLDDTLCLAHYQLGMHYKRVLDKDLALENCRGLIRCAGETQYDAEVEECKEVVRALEIQ